MYTNNRKTSERSNPTWKAYMKRQQDNGLSKGSHNNHFENKRNEYKGHGKLERLGWFLTLVFTVPQDQFDRLIQLINAAAHLVEQLTCLVTASGSCVMVAVTSWAITKMIQRLPRG